MFGREDGPSAPPPHEPTPMEQFQAVVPPMKTMKVLRAVPAQSRESFQKDGQLFETIYVTCHAIGVSDDDRTVFQVWRLNALAGPHLEVVRLLTGVVDVEEMTVQQYDGNRLV